MSPKQQAAKDLYDAVENLHNRQPPTMSAEYFEKYQRCLRILTKRFQPLMARKCGMYRQASEIVRGDQINHITYGAGIITRLFIDGFIEISFKNHGKKKFAMDIAISKMRRIKKAKKVRSRVVGDLAFPDQTPAPQTTIDPQAQVTP